MELAMMLMSHHIHPIRNKMAQWVGKLSEMLQVCVTGHAGDIWLSLQPVYNNTTTIQVHTCLHVCVTCCAFRIFLRCFIPSPILGSLNGASIFLEELHPGTMYIDTVNYIVNCMSLTTLLLQGCNILVTTLLQPATLRMMVLIIIVANTSSHFMQKFYPACWCKMCPGIGRADSLLETVPLPWGYI